MRLKELITLSLVASLLSGVSFSTAEAGGEMSDKKVQKEQREEKELRHSKSEKKREDSKQQEEEKVQQEEESPGIGDLFRGFWETTKETGSKLKKDIRGLGGAKE